MYFKKLTSLTCKFEEMAFAKGHDLSQTYWHSLKESTSTGDAGDPFNIHSDLQTAF